MHSVLYNSIRKFIYLMTRFIKPCISTIENKNVKNVLFGFTIMKLSLFNKCACPKLSFLKVCAI